MEDSSGGDGPVTLAQYEEMPEEDEYRIELSRGMLVREPMPGARHGWMAARIFETLSAFVRERGLGAVLFDTGFRLAVAPPTVRGPDVAFIAKERLPEQIPVGFWEQPPDLAVEVVSPSNRRADLEAKVTDYFGAGTRTVWLVDPQKGRVTVYRSRDDIQVLGHTDVLHGDDVLSDFSVPVRALFAER
jgi:Uma2 family endonuclease